MKNRKGRKYMCKNFYLAKVLSCKCERCLREMLGSQIKVTCEAPKKSGAL